MDRLSAWYYWKDRRSLFQAIDIAKNHDIDFKQVERWSADEGEITLYRKFLKQVTM